jgi:hypothetical protein
MIFTAHPLRMNPIPDHVDTVGALEIDADGIVFEYVVRHAAVGDVFEQQAVGRAAPVVLEPVPLHDHVAGVHDGYSGPVGAQGVIPVIAPIGEHEMQAVAVVGGHGVSANGTVFHKFQIDAVAVADNDIVFDGDVLRIPEVDAVSRARFRNLGADDAIAAHAAVDRSGQIDAEERVLQPIVFNDAPAHAVRLDGRPILHKTRLDVAKHQTAHRHMIGCDRENLGSPAVQNRISFADKVDGPVDDQVVFAIEAGSHENAGPFGGALKRFADGGEGATRVRPPGSGSGR